MNFLWFWADKVFAVNATVTLTFDLVSSKCIGVIYWVWPIFLLSTMTVTQKLFKILSGHDVANGRTDGRTDAIPSDVYKVKIILKLFYRFENAVSAPCVRHERVVNKLKQLHVQHKRHKHYKDAVGTPCGCCRDALRLLCTRCYWQIRYFRPVLRRLHSALTGFQNAVALPLGVKGA